MHKDLLIRITQNKKKIIKIALGILLVILMVFGISVFMAIDRVGKYKVDKPYEDLTFTEKTAALLKGYKFDTRKELEDKGLIYPKGKTSNNSNSNNSVKTGSVLADEHKSILTKKYDDLSDVQRTLTLEEIEKKYNVLSDSEKKNFDRLKKEKDAYIEKSIQQSKDNKQIYDDFKKEIESEYPNMKFDMITGTDKKKNLMIYAKLLDNLDMTKAKCKELVLKKETKVKDMGISKIVFTVKNKDDELQGSYMFELKNGKYELSLSSF